MSIVSGRIDFRLLHGIVATQWAPQSGAQRVMVIDDKTANDPILKESMRMGKPAGMACSIITEEAAIKNFKAGKYDSHKVFIIAEDPSIFLHLQEAGQQIPKLIVGTTRSLDNGTLVSKRASIKDEEKPIYKKIMDNGCEVQVKFVPADKDVQLSSVLQF